MERKYVILMLAFCLLASGIVTGYASYTIWSNTVNVTTTPPATLALSSNATAAIAGLDTVKLTAHISDNMPGLNVTFYEDGFAFAWSLTDANGNATVITPILNANHYYDASTIHP